MSDTSQFLHNAQLVSKEFIEPAVTAAAAKTFHSSCLRNCKAAQLLSEENVKYITHAAAKTLPPPSRFLLLPKVAGAAGGQEAGVLAASHSPEANTATLVPDTARRRAAPQHQLPQRLSLSKAHSLRLIFRFLIQS